MDSIEDGDVSYLSLLQGLGSMQNDDEDNNSSNNNNNNDDDSNNDDDDDCDDNDNINIIKKKEDNIHIENDNLYNDNDIEDLGYFGVYCISSNLYNNNNNNNNNTTTTINTTTATNHCLSPNNVDVWSSDTDENGIYEFYIDKEVVNKNINDITNSKMIFEGKAIKDKDGIVISRISSQSITIADNLLKNIGIQATTALKIGEKLAVKIQKSMQRNKTVSNVVDCANETMLFTMDRIHAKSLQIYQSLTADDPETMHWRSLRACNKENWDSVRLCMASLTWTERQLLEETKEENADEWFDILEEAEKLHEKEEFNDDSNSIETIFFNGNRWKNRSNEPINQDDHDSQQQELEPRLQQWLSKAAREGDEEAAYALSRWFSPPQFDEEKVCFACEREFGMNLFRHHCRFCGKSYCTPHSSHKRKILRFGMTEAVRVCNSCVLKIDLEVWSDSQQWRKFRTNSYMEHKLIPYTSIKVDRKVDKALRVIEGSIQLVKNTFCLNYPAHILIETFNILKRYGLSGLAGVLLRKDFVEAVETLKRISGMDKSFSISLHELTACIYYKLAIDRGVRGLHPDLEHISHQNCEDNADRNLDYDIDEAIRLAPLALTVAYEENSFEAQRLALIQGWSTIFTICEAAPEQPAYVLLGTDLNRSNIVKKEAVVAIRGTKSVQDLVTDIRSMPQDFPPNDDEIRKALSGYPSHIEISKYDIASPETDENDDVGRLKKQWEWLQASSDMTYACGGMVRAALWLISQVGQSLMKLHCEGYEIIIVGHSLGAGVASLATYLLASRIPNIRCITYGSPCCVDAVIASELKDRVTSIVLHDDIISRVTPQSIRILMKELFCFREQVFRHLERDWSDVINKAISLWPPPFRSVRNDHVTNSQSQEALECGVDDNLESSFVVVDEDEIKNLYIPGKIIHIYSHLGQYKAAVVNQTFDTLRRIEVQGNIFADHESLNIFNALLEVRSVRKASSVPPVWQPFSIPTCQCCHNSFTWHTTFTGATQEYRERYNCRNCGSLVCDPCSKEKRAIPRLGLIFPVRVCDRCFYSGDFSNATL